MLHLSSLTTLPPMSRRDRKYKRALKTLLEKRKRLCCSSPPRLVVCREASHEEWNSDDEAHVETNYFRAAVMKNIKKYNAKEAERQEPERILSKVDDGILLRRYFPLYKRYFYGYGGECSWVIVKKSHGNTIRRFGRYVFYEDGDREFIYQGHWLVMETQLKGEIDLILRTAADLGSKTGDVLHAIDILQEKAGE
jgi:hypothetical protein